MENPTLQRTQPAVHNNAMDLLSIRQYNPIYRERGECFCCGSTEYMVRSCLHPDNCPLSIYSAYPVPYTTPLIKSKSTAVSEGSRSPSPGFSEKGVSLA